VGGESLQLSSSFRFLDREAGPLLVEFVPGRIHHPRRAAALPGPLPVLYAPNLPQLDTTLGASYDDKLSQAGELGASRASEWPAIKTDK